jgi:hypothetical protein
MITLVRLLGAFLLFGLLVACSNAPIVRSDYDPRADFSSYRSFAFMEPLGTDRAGYTTLLTERLKRAVALQMESRGYIYQEKNPDVWINFQSQVQSKTEYVPPPPMMWGVGYGFGFYGGWPGYAFGPDVIQYNEGTLKVDLIDARRRQMVWEGIGTTLLGNTQQPASEALVENMVSSIFARYPFLAGSGVVQPRK